MRRGSVLLADSHSPMLEGIRSLLAERFETVVMVADERSLLETMDRLKPDLAIVDVSLPHTAGKNVIAMIHERFPGAELIALSAFGDRSVTDRILASGAVAVVQKGAAATDLGPALDAVNSRRQEQTQTWLTVRLPVPEEQAREAEVTQFHDAFLVGRHNMH